MVYISLAVVVSVAGTAPCSGIYRLYYLAAAPADSCVSKLTCANQN